MHQHKCIKKQLYHRIVWRIRLDIRRKKDTYEQVHSMMWHWKIWPWISISGRIWTNFRIIVLSWVSSFFSKCFMHTWLIMSVSFVVLHFERINFRRHFQLFITYIQLNVQKPGHTTLILLYSTYLFCKFNNFFSIQTKT